jgi:large subunit ribosomal protein L29
MRLDEIRERTDEELETLSRQLREDLFKLRVQKATNQLDDTNAPGRARKDLARVMTVLKARLIGVEQSKKELGDG